MSLKLTVGVLGCERRDETLLTSVGVGRRREFVEEALKFREVLIDSALEEVQEVLAIGRLGVDKLVDGSNLETIRAARKVCAVEVVAHGKNDVEQLLEELGATKVCATPNEQRKAL